MKLDELIEALQDIEQTWGSLDTVIVKAEARYCGKLEVFYNTKTGEVWITGSNE